MKKKLVHLGVALFLAVLVGGGAGLLSYYRDSLFEWQWVKPRGAFTDKVDETLRQAALLYYKEKAQKPGEVCVDQWVGKDERYIYMAVGCAYFEEKLGAVETTGDNNYIPTRFRYEEKEVDHYQQPDMAEFNNSIKKLFPREAYHLLAVRMNQDIYRREGLKAKEARP